ncbi:MAG: hypothetical protein HOE92_04185 [Euryarchaeota archaeon]|nr:hypothetical protein [Euryarchaeota archaeon]
MSVPNLPEVRLPARPKILDGFGERQATFRIWLPVFILISLLVASITPLLTLEKTQPTEAETEVTYTYSVFPERIDVELTGMDDFIAASEGEEELAGFPTTWSEGHDHGLNTGEIKEMQHDTSLIAKEHASNLWWSGFFTIILLFLVMERGSTGSFFSWNPRVTEIISAIISLALLFSLLFCIGSITSLGDAAPEALGYTSLEGNWFGHSSAEVDGGEESISWAPGFSLWIELLALVMAILLFVVHLLESMTPGWLGESRPYSLLSLFKKGEDCSSLEKAEKFVGSMKVGFNILPSLTLVLAIALIGTALLMPMASITQTWQMQNEGGDWEAIEVKWEASMFSTSFTNNSGFSDQSDFSPTTGVLRENATVSGMESVIDDIRMNHLTALFIILVPLTLALIPLQYRNRTGSPRLWLGACLLTSAWILSGMLTTISEGGIAFHADALSATPVEGISYFWGSSSPGTYGHVMGMATSAEGADWIYDMMVVDWNLGVGVLLLKMATFLCLLGGFASLSGVHESASRNEDAIPGIGAFTKAIHGEHFPEAGWLGGSPDASNKVAFAGITVLLLLAMTIGGAFEFGLVSEGDSAGPTLRTFDVDIDDTSDTSGSDGQLNQGGVLELTIDIPASFVENVTSASFQAGCSDNLGDFGSNNPVGEETDAIRIEIYLPEEHGGLLLVEEEDCVDNWSFFHTVGDDSSNAGTYRVQARNADSAGSLFNADDELMITVEVKITAICKGSIFGSGGNADDELYAAVFVNWQGYYGSVTEVSEE